MKHDTIIYHLSGHCCRGLPGQVKGQGHSEVKRIAHNAIFLY